MTFENYVITDLYTHRLTLFLDFHIQVNTNITTIISRLFNVRHYLPLTFGALFSINILSASTRTVCYSTIQFLLSLCYILYKQRHLPVLRPCRFSLHIYEEKSSVNSTMAVNSGSTQHDEPTAQVFVMSIVEKNTHMHTSI